MRKTIIAVLASLVSLVFARGAFAEPTGPWTYVVTLRAYSAVDTRAFISVNTNALCGTSVFAINTSAPNGKEMYAIALAATLAERMVMLEISNSTGCTGYGTLLQSIYIGID